MQSALIPITDLIIADGDASSNVLLLMAYADATKFYVGAVSGTDAAALEVSPDYDPVDPGSATWLPMFDFSSPVLVSPSSMQPYDVPAGKAFRLNNGSAVTGDQTYYIWKRTLLG